MKSSRLAFTLIELLIVITIIAIIAAIAIPQLLESRVTANEARAAASLKSAVFIAQVQYQAGGLSDSPEGIYSIFNGPVGEGGNGIPDFAAQYQAMSGGNASQGSPDWIPGTRVALLPKEWANSNHVTGGGYYKVPVGGMWGGPLIGGYVFGLAANNELGFSATANPDELDNTGRRRFAINSAGIVMSCFNPVEITPIDLVSPPFGDAPFTNTPVDSIWKVHSK